MTDTPSTMRLDHGQWRALVLDYIERLFNTVRGVAIPDAQMVTAIHSHVADLSFRIDQWAASGPPPAHSALPDDSENVRAAQEARAASEAMRANGTEPTGKRPGGWPAGKPRKPRRPAPPTPEVQ